MHKHFISYIRVSTQKQGQSGLGLEAQRKAISGFVGGRGTLIGEFLEIESGTGKRTRPRLEAALAACKANQATLVVARLDRLSRDAAFVLGLNKAGVDFIAADNPSVNRFVIGVLALVAEEEARLVSERTKAALAAAKARGVRLGHGGRIFGERAKEFAEVQRERFSAFQNEGLSYRAMVARLNSEKVPTPSGRGAWHLSMVQRICKRLVIHPMPTVAV